IPLPTHGSHASATGRRPAYFFFRRTLRPFRATLSIANSSSLRPCLMRAESHRGRAPRPAHVSPPGPRYLGGTLRPFSAERRPNPVRKLPAARPLSAPRRESCFSSSLRFSLSLLSMSARSASNASTSIPFRLIAAIRVSHSYTVELDRTIQSKAKASTPKWHTWQSTLGVCVFSSGSPPRATYDHSEEAAPFNASIDRMPPPLLVALAQFGATSMLPMRLVRSMNAAATPRCKRYWRTVAAFLQHSVTICARSRLNHRQRTRGL